MIRHNKNKNVGIIFETLCHAVVSSLVEQKEKEASRLFYLLKRYLVNESTEVNKALKIFNSLLYHESKNYFYATKFLEYLVNEWNNLDKKKLNNELVLLNEGINKTLGANKIFDIRISNYKLYASFQTLINENFSQGKFYINPDDRLNCEKCILEHFISNDENKKIKKMQQLNEEIDSDKNVVNKIAVIIALNKFKQRYQNFLTEEQNECLMKYYVAKNDTEFFDWLGNKLNTIITEVKQDKAKILLNESGKLLKEKFDLTLEKFDKIKKNKSFNDDDFANILLVFDLKDSLNKI